VGFGAGTLDNFWVAPAERFITEIMYPGTTAYLSHPALVRFATAPRLRNISRGGLCGLRGSVVIAGRPISTNRA